MTDDNPLYGADFVEQTCHACMKPIVPGKEVGCRCDKYGYGGDEEKAWCSEQCMLNEHPDA